MRIVGPVLTAAGLTGVVVCTASIPMLWILRRDLIVRSRKLQAISETGLEAASTLADTAATWLGNASTDIRAIAGKAVDVARAPQGDTADTGDLAAAIDAFVGGPYTSLRTAYAGLRERALAVDSALQDAGGGAPSPAIGPVIADLLGTIDARMLEIDASVRRLDEMGDADLATPGTAVVIAEHAAAADLLLQTVAGPVTNVQAWLEDGSARIEAGASQVARTLTMAALGGTAVSLFIAALNLQLFRQGRRLSRR